MRSVVAKWGNSLALRLPRSLAEDARATEEVAGAMPWLEAVELVLEGPGGALPLPGAAGPGPGVATATPRVGGRRERRTPHTGAVQPQVVVEQDSVEDRLQPDLDRADPGAGGRPADPVQTAVHEHLETQIGPPGPPAGGVGDHRRQARPVHDDEGLVDEVQGRHGAILARRAPHPVTTRRRGLRGPTVSLCGTEDGCGSTTSRRSCRCRAPSG